ncbi:MAG TPA: hypothetical protein PJ994_09740 [Tepidiformaceae bacterium]|nr:hypothetical protein [Tepidiformaceae bacterium]
MQIRLSNRGAGPGDPARKRLAEHPAEGGVRVELDDPFKGRRRFEQCTLDCFEGGRPWFEAYTGKPEGTDKHEALFVTAQAISPRVGEQPRIDHGGTCLLEHLPFEGFAPVLISFGAPSGKSQLAPSLTRTTLPSSARQIPVAPCRFPSGGPFPGGNQVPDQSCPFWWKKCSSRSADIGGDSLSIFGEPIVWLPQLIDN